MFSSFPSKAKQGFKSGDKLDLFQTIDTKDDKGVVVFTDEKRVSENRTGRRCRTKKAKRIIRARAAVQSGWTVKPLKLVAV